MTRYSQTASSLLFSYKHSGMGTTQNWNEWQADKLLVGFKGRLWEMTVGLVKQGRLSYIVLHSTIFFFKKVVCSVLYIFLPLK